MSNNSLVRWLKSFGASARTRSTKRPRQVAERRAFRLESLEDRLVLSGSPAFVNYAPSDNVHFATTFLQDRSIDIANTTATSAANLLKSANVPLDRVAGVLRDFYHQSAAHVADVLHQTQYSAADEIQSLRGAFGTTTQQAADLGHEAGYTFAQIGAGLTSLGNDGYTVQSTLKAIDATAQDVIQSARDNFGRTVQQAAGDAKAFGYSVRDVGIALTRLNYDGFTVQTTLQAIGTVHDVIRSAHENFGRTYAQAAGDARYLGYSIRDTALGLKDLFGAETAQRTLAEIDVTVTDVVRSARDALGRTYEQAVRDVLSLSYSTYQAGQALYELLGLPGRETVQTVLKDVGASPADLISLLRQNFGRTLDQAVRDTVSVGFTIGEAATGLRSIGIDRWTVAATLKAVGSAKDVLLSGRDLFSLTYEQAAGDALALGYSIRDVGEGLYQAYGAGFAQQAADTLKSLNGYVGAIADVLRTNFGKADHETAAILNQAGYSVETVGAVVRSAYQTSSSRLVEIYRDTLGVAQHEIESALKSAGFTKEEARQVIESAFQQVSNWFHNIFS